MRRIGSFQSARSFVGAELPAATDAPQVPRHVRLGECGVSLSKHERAPAV